MTKKVITKRDCEFLHAKNRLKERYGGLELTKSFENKLLDLIGTIHGVVVMKQSNTRKVFLVRDPDTQTEYLFVKMHKGGIITFLEREWLKKTFEELQESHKNHSIEKSKDANNKIKQINDELYNAFNIQ